MATVIVDMAFCDKKHRITAKLRDDGDLDIHIATNCVNVKAYADRIGKTVTVKDVTDWHGSKVHNEEMCSVLSSTCLAPSGVISAAWLELGMLSKSKAKKIGANCVRFTEKGSDELIDD